MLLLTGTSDKIQVITGSAGDIRVHASYVDLNGSTVTPLRANLAAITTAATTDVVGSPAASTQRNVQKMTYYNDHATVSNLVTIQHTDGTNIVKLFEATLAPGEKLGFDKNGKWWYYAASGVEQTGSILSESYKGITGSFAETMDRHLIQETNTSALTSGTLRMEAIYLKAGALVSSISFSSATTAAGTPTNGFFALYDLASRALLAQSANFTTEAWAANTVKTKAMTTAYRVPVSGIYYVAILITATTVPTLKGNTAKTSGSLALAAPTLGGNSTTGLTTSLPNPAAALGSSTATVWATVS